MRKWHKRILIFFFVMSFVGAFSLETKAAGPRDGEIVDGTLLTSDRSAEARFDNRKRSGDLACGTALIINEYNNGAIYVHGATYAHNYCDKVRIFLYLERLNDENNWEPVFNQNDYVTNDYFGELGLDLTVPKGYYYRLRAGHVTLNNGITEGLENLTNGIFIGQKDQ